MKLVDDVNDMVKANGNIFLEVLFLAGLLLFYNITCCQKGEKC